MLRKVTTALMVLLVVVSFTMLLNVGVPNSNVQKPLLVVVNANPDDSLIVNMSDVVVITQYNTGTTFDRDAVFDALSDWCDPGTEMVVSDGVVCNKTFDVIHLEDYASAYTIPRYVVTNIFGIYVKTNGVITVWEWRKYYDDRDLGLVLHIKRVGESSSVSVHIATDAVLSSLLTHLNNDLGLSLPTDINTIQTDSIHSIPLRINESVIEIYYGFSDPVCTDGSATDSKNFYVYATSADYSDLEAVTLTATVTTGTKSQASAYVSIDGNTYTDINVVPLELDKPHTLSTYGYEEELSFRYSHALAFAMVVVYAYK